MASVLQTKVDALCNNSVSNTPGNLLELFFPPGNPGNLLELFFPPGNLGNLLEIYSFLEILWFSLRVCAFVVNISYNSCISECISTKYLVVNHDQLILRLVILVSANSAINREIVVGWGLSPHASSFNLLTASKKMQSVLNFGQNVSWKLLKVIPADLLDTLI